MSGNPLKADVASLSEKPNFLLDVEANLGMRARVRLTLSHANRILVVNQKDDTVPVGGGIQ